MDLLIDYKTRKQLWAKKWGYGYDFETDKLTGLDVNPMGFDSMLEFNEIENDFKIGRNRQTVAKMKQQNEENAKKQIVNPELPTGSKTQPNPNVSTFTEEQKKQYEEFQAKQAEENKRLTDPQNISNWTLIDWYDERYENMTIEERNRQKVLYQPINGQVAAYFPRSPTQAEFERGQKPYNPTVKPIPPVQPASDPVINQPVEEKITPRVPRTIKEYNEVVIQKEKSFVDRYAGTIMMISALFIAYSLYHVYNNNAGSRPFVNFDGRTEGSLGIGTSAPALGGISNITNTSSGGGPGLLSTIASETGKTTRSVIEQTAGGAKELLKSGTSLTKDALSGVKELGVNAGKKIIAATDELVRGGGNYKEYTNKVLPVLAGKSKDAIIKMLKFLIVNDDDELELEDIVTANNAVINNPQIDQNVRNIAQTVNNVLNSPTIANVPKTKEQLATETRQQFTNIWDDDDKANRYEEAIIYLLDNAKVFDKQSLYNIIDLKFQANGYDAQQKIMLTLIEYMNKIKDNNKKTGLYEFLHDLITEMSQKYNIDIPDMPPKTKHYEGTYVDLPLETPQTTTTESQPVIEKPAETPQTTTTESQPVIEKPAETPQTTTEAAETPQIKDKPVVTIDSGALYERKINQIHKNLIPAYQLDYHEFAQLGKTINEQYNFIKDLYDRQLEEFKKINELKPKLNNENNTTFKDYVFLHPKYSDQLEFLQELYNNQRAATVPTPYVTISNIPTEPEPKNEDEDEDEDENEQFIKYKDVILDTTNQYIDRLINLDKNKDLDDDINNAIKDKPNDYHTYDKLKNEYKNVNVLKQLARLLYGPYNIFVGNSPQEETTAVNIQTKMKKNTNLDNTTDILEHYKKLLDSLFAKIDNIPDRLKKEELFGKFILSEFGDPRYIKKNEDIEKKKIESQEQERNKKILYLDKLKTNLNKLMNKKSAITKDIMIETIINELDKGLYQDALFSTETINKYTNIKNMKNSNKKQKKLNAFVTEIISEYYINKHDNKSTSNMAYIKQNNEIPDKLNSEDYLKERNDIQNKISILSNELKLTK